MRRPEVIARIRTAKEHGDLKENAEYHAAREEQSFLEGRVQAIEARLRTAVDRRRAGGRLAGRPRVEGDRRARRRDRDVHDRRRLRIGPGRGPDLVVLAGRAGAGRPRRRRRGRSCRPPPASAPTGSWRSTDRLTKSVEPVIGQRPVGYPLAMDRRIVLAGRLVRVLGIGTVAIIALATRLLAVNVLPIDFDEDDYLRAGQQYAAGLQTGDLDVFLRDNYRTEHPPLAKIVTGIAIAPLPASEEIPDRPTTAPPAASLPEPQFVVARTVQAVFGALTATLLALLSPLGGVLARHPHLVDQVHEPGDARVGPGVLRAGHGHGLRASPTRAGPRGPADRAGRRGGGVRAGLRRKVPVRGRRRGRRRGLAVALAGRSDSARQRRSPAGWPGPWAGSLLAFVVFFLADPYLWPDPVGRLWASIAYHGGYASSDAVTSTGWPSWQPLVWLMGSVPFHAPGTFLVAVDLPITILAAVGLRRPVASASGSSRCGSWSRWSSSSSGRPSGRSTC